MFQWLRSLRTEIRYLFELYLIPGVVFFFPYRWGFALLKQFAQYDRLYRADAQAGLLHAKKYVDVPSDQEFLYKFRLTRLVDHADLWWSLSRSRKVVLKFCRNTDALALTSRSLVICFFHWGAGLWLVDALNQTTKLPVAVLARKATKQSMGGYLAYFYGKIRFWKMAHVGGHQPIYPPKSLHRAAILLDEGGVVMGAPDIAPTGRHAQSCRIFGKDARFTNGLFSLVKEQTHDLHAAAMVLDEETGMREIWVASDNDGPFPSSLVFFEHLLKEKPWAYHLWPWFEQFYQATDARQ